MCPAENVARDVLKQGTGAMRSGFSTAEKENRISGFHGLKALSVPPTHLKNEETEAVRESAAGLGGRRVSPCWRPLAQAPIALPGEELRRGWVWEGNLGGTQPVLPLQRSQSGWSLAPCSQLPEPDCLREKPGRPEEGS